MKLGRTATRDPTALLEEEEGGERKGVNRVRVKYRLFLRLPSVMVLLQVFSVAKTWLIWCFNVAKLAAL
jgi:hypothetical protein